MDIKAFEARCLPVEAVLLNPTSYMESLIDATTRLEVYKTKLDGSKLERRWFLPTLQRKEALASSQIEGTQATLDGVIVDQVNPKEKDKDMSEVRNYLNAALEGYVRRRLKFDRGRQHCRMRILRQCTNNSSSYY